MVQAVSIDAMSACYKSLVQTSTCVPGVAPAAVPNVCDDFDQQPSSTQILCYCTKSFERSGDNKLPPFNMLGIQAFIVACMIASQCSQSSRQRLVHMVQAGQPIAPEAPPMGKTLGPYLSFLISSMHWASLPFLKMVSPPLVCHHFASPS